MNAAALDQGLNDHYMYEATDDVDGVVSTVTDDVKHYVTGPPLGELTGKEAARSFYAELFKDLRGEGVEPVARWHGDNFVVDEIIWTGQIEEARLFGLKGRAGHATFRLLHVLEFRDGKISRENVWPDTAAIFAQTLEKATV
jgi:ketosteroid isomerase-like protein